MAVGVGAGFELSYVWTYEVGDCFGANGCAGAYGPYSMVLYDNDASYSGTSGGLNFYLVDNRDTVGYYLSQCYVYSVSYSGSGGSSKWDMSRDG